MKLRCDVVEATTATQVRTRLHRDVIDLYAEDLKDGAVMPPVDVFNEGNGSERYILSDGFHRLLAHINAEFEEIDVEVHEGGMHEALVFALGANTSHGLRRSNADKRHAVEMALKDPEISALKRQEIADICGVTKRTVQKIANQVVVEGEPGVKRSPPGKPEKNNPGNKRLSMPEPTQAEIERDELRMANGFYKGFPYNGDGVANLELNEDDITDLEYVSEWTARAVITLRDQTVELP